jgi:hypothetical protein
MEIGTGTAFGFPRFKIGRIVVFLVPWSKISARHFMQVVIRREPLSQYAD